MTKKILAIAGAAVISGCAGVSITPIDVNKARAAHRAGGDVNGYIVYAPILAVEVSEKTVCVQQTTKDKCEKSKLVCGVGTPFVLPDYARPYVVEVKSGFGKAGVDIALKDGWLITQIKDTSENTALLGFIEKVLLADVKKDAAPAQTTGTCPHMGIYQVLPSKEGIKLELLKSYQ